MKYDRSPDGDAVYAVKNGVSALLWKKCECSMLSAPHFHMDEYSVISVENMSKAVEIFNEKNAKMGQK